MSARSPIDRRGDDRTRGQLRTKTIARGLGWFSIALGAAELLAPRLVARVTGARGGDALLRFYGLREIACGIGMLRASDPTPFAWARVGGDALDIATLAAAMGRMRPQERRRAFGVLVQLVGIGALDVHTARALSDDRLDDEIARDRARWFAHRYRNRSGFPRSPDAMRGLARKDFETPRDMRAPDALLSWTREK